jgi:proton glutamate symport protein
MFVLKWKKPGLALQIVFGLIAGVLFGYILPQYGDAVKPFGDAFIRAIKMIVVPIVFSTIIIGIAGVGDVKKVGRLGGKTILYFEIITTIAIVLGVFISNVVKPGAGIHLSDLAKTDITKYTGTAANHSTVDMLVNIVPTNIIDGMARADLLQVIFFSVFFGLAMAAVGEKSKPMLDLAHSIAEIMFKLTNMIMSFAPMGVFALIAYTVSHFGLGVLLPLGKLVGLLYITAALFIVFVFGTILKLAGVSLFKLIKGLGEELLLAYSTASSESVMPRIMRKMEQFGVPRSIVSFVIPTGYTFNLDGSALYQGMAIPFIAQMYGIHLSLSQQVFIILILMVTSKGIAGVPGASFVVLAATLSSTGLPVEGLAIIAGVDRIMDMARTAVNVMGYSVASIVMAKWEKVYDSSRATYPLQPLEEDVEFGGIGPLIAK